MCTGMCMDEESSEGESAGQLLLSDRFLRKVKITDDSHSLPGRENFTKYSHQREEISL